MKYSRMLSRSLSFVWAVLRCNKGCGKSARLANAFLIILLLSAILPTRPAFAQDTQPTYTFPECEQVEENLLLGELNRITRSVLEKEKSGLDIAKIVEDNWRDLNLDAVVDAAVDDAVEQVREDEGTWDRIFSGWSENKAKEFATKVANYAFDSTEFRDAVDRLSLAIADDLEIEIHVMTVKSASSALQCVQEFIGVTFSETMSVVLEGNIRDWLAEVDSESVEGKSPIDVLGERKFALAGFGTIVGTQIAHLLAKKVAQGILGKVVTRILGKAASAVVPVAGWIIGGVLIIIDLYQAWEGSLPQIREDFKGEKVKQELRKQIAIVVEEELNNALPDLSQSVTLDIFEQWKDFLQDFEHVLRLAEKNARFRTIVDGATADQVKKLTELVAIGDEALGAEWLARIIDTGDFESILALPKASFEILREEADPGLVLEWADLAGEGIVRVVQTELYRVATPSDFGEREILERVLALEDTVVIEELMRLGEAGRAALLRLPSAQTKWVLTDLSAVELDWLATYLTGLPTQAQGGLVDYVMRDRGLLPKLQGSEELGSKFSGVLTLAEANPTFQTILNETTADQVDKLSELVAVASEALEPEQLSDTIDAGLFEQILALPQAAFVILREKKDPALVIAWAGQAGGAIVQVVEIGLFRVASPSEFKGEEALARVLALQNRQAVRKLMLLDQGERDVLLELPVEQARPVLVALSTEDLSWLAGYFAELTGRETVLIAAYILEEPGLLPKLIVSKNLGAKFPGVLTLADQNQSFKEILGRVGVDGVEKLSDLVAVAVESLTPVQLAHTIGTDQFERILALHQSTFEILKEKKDPAVVFEWADLAGEAVAKVVATELYRVATPSDFSGRDALNGALALEDPVAIRNLMQLHQLERVVLLGLSKELARSALTALSMEDLSWLALYLAELAADEKDPVVNYILQDQGLIPLLQDKENVLSRFPRMVLLALEIPRFETILNSTYVIELEKLSELVAAADATLTPEQLAEMIESGQFERIFALPQAAFDILREAGNPELVLKWADLAGEAIVQVVRTGLYQITTPSEFSGHGELEQLLALEDPEVIKKLMLLNRDGRVVLLELPTDQSRSLLIALSAEDLGWLAAYLPELSPLTPKLLVDYLVREPTLISQLRESKGLSAEFPRVLNLAVTNPNFREILDNTSVDEVGKLSDLVIVADETLGPEQLTAMIESGQFKSIFELPKLAFEILRVGKDPAEVVAWDDLADEAIVDVVETGLFHVASPDDFKGKEELDPVLAFRESDAMAKLMGLKQVERDVLLKLETEKARALLFADMWLIVYLPELSAQALEVLVAHVPTILPELMTEIGRQALLESQNKEVVLNFLAERAKESKPVLPTIPMLAAAVDTIAGDLPGELYWHYYSISSLILLSLVVVLIILALSGWWLFRRRQQATGEPTAGRPKRG